MMRLEIIVPLKTYSYSIRMQQLNIKYHTRLMIIFCPPFYFKKKVLMLFHKIFSPNHLALNYLEQNSIKCISNKILSIIKSMIVLISRQTHGSPL